MRIPTDPPTPSRSRRRGVIAFAVFVAVVLLLVLVQGLSGFYANYLWFHYSGVGEVWRSVILTKVGLAATFIGAAFVLFWLCLYLVDKVAPRAMFMAPDTELVRRYQSAVGPHAFALRTAVSFVLALVVGVGASTQWQHWLLFEHAVSFGRKDPVFSRDASFFVFRLPFLSFLVDWVFVALVVALVLTAVAYFLNGAVRIQGLPRLEPRALAHLSLLLGLMALVRAWAYYYVDRFALDLSAHGVVSGASYTDVHVRLPAMTLLAVVSLAAFVMLIFNVYQRTVALPTVAVSLFVLLALVLGVVYPAAVQAFRVTPAQSTLELPYIARNIKATSYAMGISKVAGPRTFPANEDLTPGVLARYQSTLDATAIWDPVFASPTFQKLQDVRSYYRLSDLTIDRYRVNGTLEPTLVGVRSLNSSGLANQSWVNTHLQYTHGYGAVVAPANTATANGTPQFILGNVPPSASTPGLALRQPAVYFAPGMSQYVIANTKQGEVDYEVDANSAVESHYRGSGGIPLGSLEARLAFAVHLRDFNLLISNLITPHSRLIYIPGVRTLVQRALPFLRVDSHPYAVVANGQIYWMVDAYTTSAYYPYGQSASTGALSGGSGLSGQYNYVRDAVKVVVNAYSGKMQAYVVDSNDPIIRSYERAFPGLFRPLAQMAPRALLQHLRYPQDLLTVQAAMYGRYHITSASSFYSLSDAWELSQTSTSAGNGSPSAPLPLDPSGSVKRFTPIYELLQLPGETAPTFTLLEPLVPFSAGDKLQTLSALLVANSSASRYGDLAAFRTPTGRSIDGPGLANADIKSNAEVSKQITLLDSGGSTVSLGTVMVLPIADSLLYVRPLYVSSSQTSYPQLVDVVVVYGKQVAMAPTLDEALAVVFGASVPGSSGGSGAVGGTVPAQVRVLIAEAVQDYDAAQAALAKGNLGAYQADVTKAGQLLNQADTLLKATKATTRASVATAAAKRHAASAALGRSASVTKASTSASAGSGNA